MAKIGLEILLLPAIVLGALALGQRQQPGGGTDCQPWHPPCAPPPGVTPPPPGTPPPPPPIQPPFSPGPGPVPPPGMEPPPGVPAPPGLPLPVPQPNTLWALGPEVDIDGALYAVFASSVAVVIALFSVALDSDGNLAIPNVNQQGRSSPPVMTWLQWIDYAAYVDLTNMGFPVAAIGVWAELYDPTTLTLLATGRPDASSPDASLYFVVGLQDLIGTVNQTAQR